LFECLLLDSPVFSFSPSITLARYLPWSLLDLNCTESAPQVIWTYPTLLFLTLDFLPHHMSLLGLNSTKSAPQVIWTHPALSHVWFLTASYVAFKQISLPPSLSICLSLSLAWSLNPRYQLHGKCTSGNLNLPCSVSLLFSYRIICLF
jgi:hypothetical protein